MAFNVGENFGKSVELQGSINDVTFTSWVFFWQFNRWISWNYCIFYRLIIVQQCDLTVTFGTNELSLPLYFNISIKMWNSATIGYIPLFKGVWLPKNNPANFFNTNYSQKSFGSGLKKIRNSVKALKSFELDPFGQFFGSDLYDLNSNITTLRRKCWKAFL